MSQHQGTQNVCLQLKRREACSKGAHDESCKPQWIDEKTVGSKDHFLRNLSVASALVLCAVALRSGALPTLNEASDIVMTAATDQSLLDDKLGKLSFVSAMFPEAVLVFGDQTSLDSVLSVAASDITHAWSEHEPYTSWQSETVQVYAPADGEVTGIFHGNGEERIVEITGNNNLTWLYGNIGQVAVTLGEKINAGTEIGRVIPGGDIVLEIRENGRSINPMRIYGK